MVSERQIDFLLVHSYGYSDNPNRPNIRGRIVIEAARWLYQKGLVDKIVVAGGRIGGEDLPNVSGVTAQELKKKLHCPDGIIIILPSIEVIEKGQSHPKEVRSTEMEIMALLQAAGKEATIASIADPAHYYYVQRQHRRLKTGAEVINAKRVIQNIPDIGKRYWQKLSKFYLNKGQLIFVSQEIIKNIVDLVPFGDRILQLLASRIKTKPNLGGN